ncbi:LysM-like peptidoglycan-binding domain-containing protein [Vibrio sonorensis]|uniref:LysM-like peptidoglycan-binding domain-containing protein n=1 Tax=Vibrio sonorensis TaxID=1004316 RepID=UPI0008D9E477|nr:LysM-like peptidoglycan-binding domain-containing protein [Vibrio sonorensis]
MNRRRKKTKQVDHVEDIKRKLSSVDWERKRQQAITLWSKLPKFHQRALMVLAPVVLVVLLIPFPSVESEQAEPISNERVAIDINTQGLSEQQTAQQTSPKSDIWKEYQVKDGDTLAAVFRNVGLPMADLNALVSVEGSDKPLSRIKKGQLVRFKLADDGKLDILQLEKSAGSVMFFRLSDGGFGRSK